MKLLIYFIIFGLTGLVFEVISRGIIDSIKYKSKALHGKVSLWMFPIYGSILFIVFIVQLCIPDYPLWFRGISYGALISGWEFLSGMILRKLFDVKPWDYANHGGFNGTARKKKYNIKGLVCLEYFPIWAIMGLIAETLYVFLENI